MRRPALVSVTAGNSGRHGSLLVPWMLRSLGPPWAGMKPSRDKQEDSMCVVEKAG